MIKAAIARLMLAASLAAWGGASEGAALTIVAIGASNTSGWGVGEASAYPARLEELLRSEGRDVRVINAGVPFETTNGMLARIDRDVPEGTRIVVLQPGGNDLRFFGSRAKRTANVEAMVARLCARGIASLVYDPVFAPDDYQWDRIHLTREAHARIARELLPRIGRLLAAKRSGC